MAKKKFYSSGIKCTEGSRCNIPSELKVINISNGASLNNIDYPDSMGGMDMESNADIAKVNKMKHPKG